MGSYERIDHGKGNLLACYGRTDDLSSHEDGSLSLSSFLSLPLSQCVASEYLTHQDIVSFLDYFHWKQSALYLSPGLLLLLQLYIQQSLEAVPHLLRVVQAVACQNWAVSVSPRGTHPS